MERDIDCNLINKINSGFECDFIENFYDRGCKYPLLYSTPTPAPSRTIIIIFNGIDNGLSEINILKCIWCCLQWNLIQLYCKQCDDYWYAYFYFYFCFGFGFDMFYFLLYVRGCTLLWYVLFFNISSRNFCFFFFFFLHKMFMEHQILLILLFTKLVKKKNKNMDLNILQQHILLMIWWWKRKRRRNRIWFWYRCTFSNSR